MRYIDQYLSRFAEPESDLAHQIVGIYTKVLIIPAHAEGENIRHTFLSIPNWDNLLVILVINSNQGNSSNLTLDANISSLRWLHLHFGDAITLQNGHQLFQRGTSAVLMIDRFSPQNSLPSKQGVGLARKIAADIALALYQCGKLKTEWLHCTDADAILPIDYFEHTEESGFVAYHYGFEHDYHNPDIKYAAILYEISLRHHRLGLLYAGSPYAFHSIGSLLKINLKAYAQVRGFPKRQAGEDFYLLNKLRKLGKIGNLRGHPILLSGRLSSRVPFGTGPAVQSLLKAKRHIFYHHRVYQLLAIFLSHCENQVTNQAFAVFNDECTTVNPVNKQLLNEILSFTDYQSQLEQLWKKYSDPEGRHYQIFIWFDAFKTLKFIHALTELSFPKVGLETAMVHAPYVKEQMPHIDLEDLNLLNRHLQQLELLAQEYPQNVQSRNH